MFSAFNAADKAKKGIVSKDEFNKVCKKTNSNLTSDEINRVTEFVGKKATGVDYQKLAKDLNLNDHMVDVRTAHLFRTADLAFKGKSELNPAKTDLTLVNLQRLAK